MTIYVPLIKYWNLCAIFGNFEGRWLSVNCSKSQYTITRERSSEKNPEGSRWAVSKQKRRLSFSVLILNVLGSLCLLELSLVVKLK